MVKEERKWCSMKDKGHFYISLSKSLIRIAGCVLALAGAGILSVPITFLLAEVLGIAEEVFDKR